MPNRSICRRCHRDRPVDNTRCCPSCAAALRAMERSKRRIQAEAAPAAEVSPPEPPSDTLPA